MFLLLTISILCHSFVVCNWDSEPHILHASGRHLYWPSYQQFNDSIQFHSKGKWSGSLPVVWKVHFESSIAYFVAGDGPNRDWIWDEHSCCFRSSIGITEKFISICVKTCQTTNVRLAYSADWKVGLDCLKWGAVTVLTFIVFLSLLENVISQWDCWRSKDKGKIICIALFNNRTIQSDLHDENIKQQARCNRLQLQNKGKQRKVGIQNKITISVLIHQRQP